MTHRAPSVHPRNADPGAGSRIVEIVWHAEGGYSSERCFIKVYRHEDGRPMVEINAPADAVTVAYEGPIAGVEEVDDDVDERDVVAAKRG